MSRKQFRKKQILGLIKTYHAKKRQIEREVSDQLLLKILSSGELQDRGDNGKVVVYEGYQIYLSSDLNLILTVVAPDLSPSSPKAIPKEVGDEIKDRISNNIQDVDSISEEDDEELSFKDYIDKGLF